MKKLTKIVFVVLAAIVLVSTVAVLTPRVVRAVAAQLVQDVDSPPRNAWSGNCRSGSIPTTGAYWSCSIPTGAASTVIELQTITFDGITDALRDHIVISLNPGSVSVTPVWHAQIKNTVLTSCPPQEIFGESFCFEDANEYGPKNNYFFWSSPLTIYSIPGVPITIGVATAGPNPNGSGGIISLTGYSVSIAAPAS